MGKRWDKSVNTNDGIEKIPVTSHVNNDQWVLFSSCIVLTSARESDSSRKRYGWPNWCEIFSLDPAIFHFKPENYKVHVETRRNLTTIPVCGIFYLASKAKSIWIDKFMIICVNSIGSNMLVRCPTWVRLTMNLWLGVKFDSHKPLYCVFFYWPNSCKAGGRLYHIICSYMPRVRIVV